MEMIIAYESYGIILILTSPFGPVITNNEEQ